MVQLPNNSADANVSNPEPTKAEEFGQISLNDVDEMGGRALHYTLLCFTTFYYALVLPFSRDRQTFEQSQIYFPQSSASSTAISTRLLSWFLRHDSPGK